MSETVPAVIIGKLREALAGLTKTKTYREIVEPKDEVFARFQPVFSPQHIPQITGDEFKSFLLVDNNRHWTGLHRQGNRICSDMPRLREALSILVDESRPVDERLDLVTEAVSGVGKNIATAILIVMKPDKYGVWNNRSEANMKRLGIWPDFKRGEPFGRRYVQVNQILLQLRDALDTDLWTLDSLWWYLDITEGDDTEIEPDSPPTSDEKGQRFGLERHLHEFMRDNWDRLVIGNEWEIYREAGDDEAGYEYPCDVGRIDLLARHRKRPDWLVIELKRNRTSDQTVGQLLRYIGWVTQHLADESEKVHGMIICREADDGLRYALSTLPDIELWCYEVEFRLKKPDINPGVKKSHA